MPKVWEPRVGKLLHPEYFPWSFKPADSSRYGGQPRIDYLACDLYGCFWMIEVKQLGPDRKSINIENDVSIGQRNALDAVSEVGAVALLAVGCGSRLYIFTWERIRWLQSQGHWPRVLLNDASAIFHWTGPTDWARPEMAKLLRLIPIQSPSYGVLLGKEDPVPTPPTVTQPSPPSEDTEPSPSISKPMACTPMPDDLVLVRLAPSFSAREKKSSSSARSRPGGGKS
jgi:hypothetical protein